jgi:ATP-dependent protease ClpP protease subunit
MPCFYFAGKFREMSKMPFQISAVKNGAAAEIRIHGHIGWGTGPEEFRRQAEALAAEGAQDVHVYINSPGGNCFDAAEIANIITSTFKGSITGEGGALVASAATYISMRCKSFVMPENGVFMVHRPFGEVSGRTEDVEAYSKLLRDVESDYRKTYLEAVKDLSLFEEKWKSGDWWMTAKEAAEQGFITGVKPKVKIDRATASAVKACGCPIEIDYQPQKSEKEMDVKTTAVLLGLPETATEAEVRAMLEANRKAAADLSGLRAAQAEKEKSEKEAKIKALLDNAIAGKRIKADCRAEWEKMLNDSFESAGKALESIAPLEKPSAQTVASKEGKKTYRGKTFAELQDENPDALRELETNDPEAFAELFNETYKK